MKSAEERSRKYIAKFNPEITRQRLVATKEETLEKYLKGVNRLCLVQDIVSNILNDRNIGGGVRTTYHAFARKLQKRFYISSLVFWDDLARGCVQDFVISYGLDKETLEKIAFEIQDVIRLFLTIEGKFRPSEKELEMIKEKGKTWLEKHPEFMSEMEKTKGEEE